jgi:hypothetical protein
VEDLPGVDLVGPELVGSLHPRRRERGIPGRGREGTRVRQAEKQARRRRREWEWEEQDGTPAQHLLLEPKHEGFSLPRGDGRSRQGQGTDVAFLNGAGPEFWRPIWSLQSKYLI